MQVLLLNTATKIWAAPNLASCECLDFEVDPSIELWLALAGYAWESRGEPVSVNLAQERHFLPAAIVISENPYLLFHVGFEPASVFSPEELINHTVKLVWEVLEAYQGTVLELSALALKKKMIGRKNILRVVNSRPPGLSKLLWCDEVRYVIRCARVSARR